MRQLRNGLRMQGSEALLKAIRRRSHETGKETFNSLLQSKPNELRGRRRTRQSIGSAAVVSAKREFLATRMTLSAALALRRSGMC